MQSKHYFHQSKNFLTFIISLFLLYANFESSAQKFEQPKKYICHKTIIAPKIDGDINESVWNLAEKTDYFIDIQGISKPIPEHQTFVKMLWSDSFLYVAAFLQEPKLWANLKEDESIIFYDNDFEIFIDPDGDRQNYYEFEFNQLNKKWDLFLLQSYMDFGKTIYEFNPENLKHEVKLFGSINNPSGKNDSAWTIEIAIPLYTLCETLPDRKFPKVNDCWRINFSRVEWQTKIENGKYIKLKKPEDNWVWSPQHTINMHRPEQWGYLLFKDNNIEDSAIFTDKYWNEKMLLMDVYYAEQKHFEEFGNYTSIKNMNSEEYKNIQILFNNFQYTAAIKANDNTLWLIDNTGKLRQITLESYPDFGKFVK